MSRPDPEEYARQVLWQLCGIRAELKSVSQDVIAIRRQLGLGPELGKALQDLETETALQQQMYEQACQRAGVAKDAPPSAPPERS